MMRSTAVPGGAQVRVLRPDQSTDLYSLLCAPGAAQPAEAAPEAVAAKGATGPKRLQALAKAAPTGASRYAARKKVCEMLQPRSPGLAPKES